MHFPGFVANPWAYMRRSTALVLSSIYEGLALVLTEAMACGTSVIAADCPYGPKAMINEARNGYLVEMRDPEEMAQAMVHVATHPDEARQKACTASQFVERFSAEHVSRDLQSMLLGL